MPRLARQDKQPSQAQLVARAAGAERLRAANKVRRVQPVRSTRQFVEAEDHVREEGPRKMKSTGPARQSLEPRLVEPVEHPVSNDKLAILAFMEELVTVHVHDTTDPTAVPVPPVWNDGRSQYFIRGHDQVVKRKFIEVLARCKRTVYSQEKYVDGNGDEGYKQLPHSALLYPFSVVEDTQKGRDWLKRILAEA